MGKSEHFGVSRFGDCVMGDVVASNIVTTLPVPVQNVLQGALDAGLTDVVVCGFDADGNDFFASSNADAGVVNWYLDRAKWRLMQKCDAGEGGDG